MDDDEAQTPQSRASEFSGGAFGGGSGVHQATAIQQADPTFNPSSSVLMAANQYSGIGNATSESTLRISSPYDLAMKQTLQASGKGTTQ